MNEDLELRIYNIQQGFRNYGYAVLSTPILGCEQRYYEELRKELIRLETEFSSIKRIYKCRGKSKRALDILHRSIEEPCFGVRVENRQCQS